MLPFRESEEVAAHWTSPNKQAAIGYCATVIVVAIGVISEVSQLDKDGTTASLLTSVAVIAVLTPTVMTVGVLGHSKGCFGDALEAPEQQWKRTENPASKD